VLLQHGLEAAELRADVFANLAGYTFLAECLLGFLRALYDRIEGFEGFDVVLEIAEGAGHSRAGPAD
jgi:hypothetical protein